MKNDSSPLVSIVIPVYNGEAYLEEAIASCLNQRDTPAEILVVDDGSSDNTHLILKKFDSLPAVRVLHHPGHRNLGVSRSRDLGLRYARGRYIAFLDADDAFLPEKTAIQIEAMQDNPDVVLCHSGILLQSEIPDAPDRASYFQLASREYKYDFREEPYFLVKNRICNSTAVVRSSALKGIDFTADQLFQFEDWLLWILLAAKGKFLFRPERLALYRYHTSSATARIDARPLMGLYSKIELLLCLLAKPEHVHFRDLIARELQEALSMILRRYMGKRPQDPLPESAASLLRGIGP